MSVCLGSPDFFQEAREVILYVSVVDLWEEYTKIPNVQCLFSLLVVRCSGVLMVAFLLPVVGTWVALSQALDS